MRAQEFILKENRNYLCEAYQRRTVTLLEEFCRQSINNKFSARQILEMFEAIPTTAPAAGQAAPQDIAALQQGKQVLAQTKTALAQGIQRTGEQPVANFDQQFDAFAAKLGQKFPATTKVIHAFREWGEENPVAEHAILFAMATAANVAVPGLIGSAIVVGLLTMAYKLILGKPFSHALKAGAAGGLIAGALGSAVNGIDALATAHHASPVLTKGVESIAHGAVEHGAGGVIGDLAAGGVQALNAVAKTLPNVRGAVSAARAGNYAGALSQVGRA